MHGENSYSVRRHSLKTTENQDLRHRRWSERCAIVKMWCRAGFKAHRYRADIITQLQSSLAYYQVSALLGEWAPPWLPGVFIMASGR